MEKEKGRKSPITKKRGERRKHECKEGHKRHKGKTVKQKVPIEGKKKTCHFHGRRTSGIKGVIDNLNEPQKRRSLLRKR